MNESEEYGTLAPVPFSEVKDSVILSESPENVHGLLSSSSAILKRSVVRNGVCKLCNKRFRNLPSHMIVHSENRTRDYECKICGKQYLSRNGLIFHQESHSSEKTLKCQQCEKAFTSKLALTMHVGQAHRTFLCNMCGKLLGSSASLARHVRSHTGSKPYVCNVCDKGFAYSNVLNDHMLIHFGEKPHVCPICGMKFRQKSGMKQHVQYVHNGKKDIDCEFCGQKFKRKIHLESHISVKHKNNPSSFGPCNICGKFYRTAFTLKRHMALHEAPIQCEICHKGFSSEEKLKCHLELYKGRKPIPCSICSRHFHVASSAKRHELLHVAEEKSKKQTKEAAFVGESTMQRPTFVEVTCDYEFDPESNDQRFTERNPFGIERVEADFYQGAGLALNDSFEKGEAELDDRIPPDDNTNAYINMDYLLFDGISVGQGQNKTNGFKVVIEVGGEDCYVPFDTHQTSENSTLNNGITGQPNDLQSFTSDGSEYLTSVPSNGESVVGGTVKFSDQDGFNSEFLIIEPGFGDIALLDVTSYPATDPRSTICETCGIVTTNITLHQKTHNKTTVKCDKCGKICLQRSMRYHMKTHEEKKFRCTFCSKQFLTKSSLIQHESVHSKDTPFQCRYCLKNFRTKRHLTPHLRTHTGEKPYPCRVCGKKFGYYNARNDHERIHSGTKPYVCHICKTSFTQRSSLRSHMVTHTKEKSFRCGICGKAFSRKQDCLKHSKIHDEDRKLFSCELCDKSFTGKFNLRHHQMRHEKLSCDICMVQFSSAQELKKHEARFKGKPPVCCGACDKSFHYKASLLKHMKKHTGLDV